MKTLLDHVAKHIAQCRVLLVGDLILDEYLMGIVERVSREAPIPIVREKSREWVAGGAANAALNLKSAGANVFAVSVIGADAAAKNLKELLIKKEIVCDGVLESQQRKTTKKQRIVSAGQQLLRVDDENTTRLSDHDLARLCLYIDFIIDSIDIIVLSDYGEGLVTRPLVEELLKRAHAHNILLVADPRGPNFDVFKGVHVLKPNKQEFAHIADFCGVSAKKTMVEQAREVMRLLDVAQLVITLGDEGICGVTHNEVILEPAHRREVFDINGAGDTTVAYLAVGLATGLTLAESITLANAAAAVSVSYFKVYAVPLGEVAQEFLPRSKRRMCSDKVFLDWVQLKHVVDAERARGKKIVFTNGCFDILHEGHILSLEQAASEGDFLLVALNTDASVSKLKGPSRPIKNEHDRSHVMASLGIVDAVTLFAQDVPDSLIAYLKPDVVVKGGEYKAEDLSFYDLVRGYGGEVKLTGYQEGTSTTNFVKKMQQEVL